jgi:hypothetical protein
MYEQPLYNKTVKILKKVWPALEQPHPKKDPPLVVKVYEKRRQHYNTAFLIYFDESFRI